MNAMIWHRGAPGDYDNWARITHDPSWSYPDVLQYFRKCEATEIPHFEKSQHGTQGPWPSTYPPCKSQASEQFIEAAAAYGIQKNWDLNGVSALGVNRLPTFTKNRWRKSTNASYLEGDSKVNGRKNLIIGAGSHVTRIIFEGHGETLRATGVEFTGYDGTFLRPSHIPFLLHSSLCSPTGKSYTVRARHEVILSAGAIQSPHLLLLSGVGPAAQLTKHGIPVVKNVMGVGKNLQDHLMCSIVWRCKDGISFNKVDRNENVLPNLLRHRLPGNGGPLTTNFAEAAAFIRSDLASVKMNDPASHETTPHLELLLISAYAQKNALFRPNHTEMFSVGPVLLCPLSVGEILLSNADPFSKPLIKANYLSDQMDLDTMVEGLKISMKIIDQWKKSTWIYKKSINPETGGDLSYRWNILPNPDAATVSALQNEGYRVVKGTELVFEQYSGPEDSVYAGDFERFIRENSETLYHPVGTCKVRSSHLDEAQRP